MATVNGGSGDDSLSGTSDDDTITAGAGNDTVDAGAGDDSILGESGTDFIDAGDGADTVQGGTGNDTILGGEGADSLHGNEDDDQIFGGGGNDTLYGDLGNDSILGGDGDDLIYAGDGDNVIAGGAGSDTIYGHAGADTFVVSAGSGSDTIEDFTPADGDLIAIDYPGITTYAELQPYLGDDGNYGTLISLPDGSVTEVRWLNHASLSESYFIFGSGGVCFLKGTLIDTPGGPRPVEALRAGDAVLTHDHGAQPLRFVSRTTYRFRPGPHRMKPIRIRPGAFGPGWPTRELLVSPQHRIALPQAAPRRLYPARALLALPGVSTRPACRLARYYHLLLDRHELIRANGAWTETLLVTRYSAERARLPPGLDRGAAQPARPIARGRAAAAEAAALLRAGSAGLSPACP